MGSGTSTGRFATPDASSAPAAERVAALPKVEVRGDLALVTVLPEDQALKRKGDVLQLEVGSEGLRLLRPSLGVPVGMWSWGHIHSWATSPFTFTFKWFDESKRTVQQHRMTLRDDKELLQHMDKVTSAILAERKSNQISTEAFNVLLKRVRSTDDAAYQLQLLRMADSTFTSKQGKQVLELLPAFDKIEAAAVLHGMLIDQNCFSFMLEALECPSDQDNVWHRIMQLRKKQGSRI